MSRAFSLIEATVATVIVGVLVVAALNATGAAAKSRRALSDRDQARALADNLLAEIATRAYEDPSGAATLGLDADDVLVGQSRSGFDDVDDYNGLVDAPPRDVSGTQIAGAGALARSVTVATFTLNSGVLAGSGSSAAGKLIRVTVTRAGAVLAECTLVRTRGGDAVKRVETAP